VRWQRERWAALPDVPYKGITFTMPDVLWPLFRENPHVTAALSALAARIIQTRVSIRSGLRVGVMTILHTIQRKVGVQFPCSHHGYSRRIGWRRLLGLDGVLRL
jgi:hypothetical protein